VLYLCIIKQDIFFYSNPILNQMIKNLPISRFLAFFLFLAVTMFSTTGLQASCNTPTTIVSAQAGNWNSNSTWVGGVVPDICDFVIVKHNINLNQGINVGQNGNGGLTINAGVTLSGSNSITINPGYFVVNNGTVSVHGFSIQGSGIRGADDSRREMLWR
jgi:hypothetical protein